MKIQLPKKIDVPSTAILNAAGSVVTYAVKPVADVFLKVIAQMIDEYRKLKTMPDLCSNKISFNTEYAEKILKGCELNYILVPLAINDANPKYRNYSDRQVVHTIPKAGAKIQPTETVVVGYITQEVIDQSVLLYDETERKKQERALEKQKKKEEKKAKEVKQSIKLFKKRQTEN